MKGDYYTCLLQDSCFWSEENVIWRKGDIIPNYYNFQVKSNEHYYKRDKDKKPLESFLYQLPVINYPDSILEMYNN